MSDSITSGICLAPDYEFTDSLCSTYRLGYGHKLSAYPQVYVARVDGSECRKRCRRAMSAAARPAASARTEARCIAMMGSFTPTIWPPVRYERCSQYRRNRL